MNLADFLQYIWVPVVGIFWSRIESVRREASGSLEKISADLQTLTIRVAAEYARKEEFHRLDAKLDILSEKIEKILIEVARKSTRKIMRS